MKKLLIILLLLSGFCLGQSQELQFTTKHYDAVNKWVAFHVTDDFAIVGFIYFDTQAGFNFYYEINHTIGEIKRDKQGHVSFASPEAENPRIEKNGIFFYNRALVRKTSNGFEVIPKEDWSGVRQRLGTGIFAVAVLSDEMVKQLGLEKEPDWLKHYENREGPKYYVRLASELNHIGASDVAIDILSKLYKKEPHLDGLEFELAYAYNATRQFDKAIDILNKAIKNDSKNFWFYKELGYAYVHQQQPDNAEKVHLQGIKLTADKSLKAEMAFNMASLYFTVKNKGKFELWAKLAKQYLDTDSQFYQYLLYFEENWSDN